MGGFGSIWHWVIVLLVIILLFGAKKIPELAKGLGSGIKNFKKAVREDEEEENIIQAQEIKKEQPKKVSAPRKPRATSSTSTKKSTKTATKKTTTRKTKEA